MNNETKYELKLDAKDFIDKLNQIQDILRKIDGIITQQSGKKFAIDVQIKNADVMRVFENLAKIMERTNGDAERIGTSLERVFGKSKSIDRASKAIETYEKAVKTSSQRVKASADKTSETITNIYKKNTEEVLNFINKADAEATQFSRRSAATYSKAVLQIKKDLDSLGINTSNMSAKDLVKFQQELNKMYDRRKTSQDLTSTFREGWTKTLNSVHDKMLESEGRLSEVRKRNIEAETDKFKAERVKAEYWIQERVNAQIAKEEQRRMRLRLYGQNVQEASNMLRAQIADENAPEEQKLISKYNRAVQRIRGIYQSAIIHGRVENPETILAGLTELQQRSFALNNYRLSDQMGINELNNKLKTTVRQIEELGTRLNKVSSVVQNSVQAFATIQNYARNITSTFISFSRNILTRVASQVKSLVSDSTEAFQSLETSLIGFKNFFGEESTERLYRQIKSIAAEAPGLATTDLAEYVRQIAPVANHDANLALNASLGMLKTIQYGGASGSTEMEYVIKNIRDVLTKGKATAIDIRQFNRAMPILEEVLESVGQSQLLKDGVLTINKDNVDTILSAFAELNTSNQSAVKDIFAQMNKTLSGQWEQFREQFTTNLMEVFRGSGVYGGMQNFLSQINEGKYVNDALARLQNAIAKFIDGINWFKVQRVATEIWEGLKTIWEGIKDAIGNIAQALGRVRSGDIISSFAEWIADLIRGLGSGVAQVVKFVQYLERSGIMSSLSRVIGWFGSVGANLTKMLGTMLSHLTNIIGNVVQVAARYTKANAQNQLKTLTKQLDALPITARSQIASSANLLNGTGIAADEVSAINNLTNIVNAHLTSIEANQLGSTKTLGRVETAMNNGKRYFFSDDYDGRGNAGIAVWDNKSQSWKLQQGFASNQRDVGYAEYQRLITQNRLQASNNAFLQRVGNNKYVDSTLRWMKTAGAKVVSFTKDLMSNVIQGGLALSLTEATTGVISSLDMFGDATTAIAGIVKTAGYALSGALVGRTFGGIAGGVIGGLVGLGIGIANLVNTINEQEKSLANNKLSESLDDAEKAMRDQVVTLLKQYGFTVDKDTRVGAGALQQLDYYIKSTPAANRTAEEAIRYYNEAYKMLSVGYALQSYTADTSSEYNLVGGTKLDFSDTSSELFKSLVAVVRKYGLAEGFGYYYGEGVDGRSYYRDSGLLEEIPGEELLEAAFQNGVTDEQANKLLEKANQLDKEYGDTTVGKLDKLVTDNTEFKDSLSNIDANVAALLAVALANAGEKGLSDENMGRIYGEEAEATAKKYTERFENGGSDWGLFWKSGGVTGVNFLAQGNYDYDKVYPKLMQEKKAAEANNEPLRAKYLEEWAKYLTNMIYDENTDEFDYIKWLVEMRKLYNKQFNQNLVFAGGGAVPTAPAYAARGIDTVPAMLAPGEFVMKPSIVRKAGLGVMHALNRGDLGAAARTLSQQISNRTWNRNDSSTINNRITNNNTNNFRIFNRNNSARMNSYRSLANRLAF